MTWLADADLTVTALVTTRLRLLLVPVHVRLVGEALAVGDGKHHHADAREDVAVIV